MEDVKKQEIEDIAYFLWSMDVMKLFNTRKLPAELDKEHFLKTEGHIKYFPKAEKVYQKRLKAKLTKKYSEIIVPNSGYTGWGGGAYTLCFLYTKHHGNFVVKGYMKEVEEFIKSNYTHYFCNFSLWYRGMNRDIWSFWKDGVGIFEPSKDMKRWKWEVRPYTGGRRDISLEESENKCLRFKRLPKRWIPEFDKL
jgi:hypothetical protein